MKSPNARILLLNTGYREGIIFSPQDTAAINDILTRATRVDIDTMTDKITANDGSLDIDLILPSRVTEKEEPEATYPPIHEIPDEIVNEVSSSTPHDTIP